MIINIINRGGGTLFAAGDDATTDDNVGGETILYRKTNGGWNAELLRAFVTPSSE